MPGKTDFYHRWKNQITGVLSDGFQSCISAVFPEKCLLCKEFIPSPYQDKPYMTESKLSARIAQNEIIFTHNITGIQAEDLEQAFNCLICESCLNEVSGIRSPWCPSCGLPYDTENEIDHLCGSCLTNRYHFNHARSVVVYNENVRDLVYQFKYNSKLQLGDRFGFLLFRNFIRCWAEDQNTGLPDLILPVPLHKKKMRKRGFNQSAFMLRKWSKYLDRSGLISQCDTKQKILVRKRWTESQTGLGKKERFKNIKGAFLVTDSDAVDGKHVLLVDDVLTTGATLNECTRVLIKNKVKKVDVLTFARRV